MEFLKEHLSEALYAQLEDELAGNVKVKLVNAKDGTYLPRKKIDEVNDEVTALKGQLKERDDQLKALAKDGEASEKLKATITELQDANKAATKEHDLAIANIRKDYAIKEALKDAKDPVTVMPLLKMDEVKLDKDGNLVGMEAQLETIKKEKAFLFNEPANPPAGGGTNPPGGDLTPAGQYLAKYQEAIKAGNTQQAIAIKQQAFSDGIVV